MVNNYLVNVHSEIKDAESTDVGNYYRNAFRLNLNAFR